ncbi:MAG TPA: hypothetical protein VHK68_05950 [Gemmatimonadales bacterium]|nr:hypothetical protein [Gemmatimonadales bacterium]
MRKPAYPTLLLLLLIYAAASLIHFIHNAEFLADYPNLPTSWSRTDIYLAWMALTLVGFAGWVLVSRGYRVTGLLFLAGYAALGLDSLGHYVLAPMAAHTAAMNWTILLEVTAAALVLIEVMRQMAYRVFRPSRSHLDA